MGIESRYIWMDGKLVPFADANVHVLSHTLHYGVGVFEGIRAYRQTGGGGGVWRLDDHLQRLVDSARMCRMPLRLGVPELRAACLETLRANEMEECYIRPLVYFGMGAMGLGARSNPVHVAIAVWDWGKYLGDAGFQQGIRVKVSSFARNHVNSSLQRAKIVGSYVNSVMARYEAADDNYDEAILLDTNGLVAEGTGENVFVVGEGVVRTPPIVNILGGITRASAMEILRHDGAPLVEQAFGRDLMYVADEMFLVGTAAEVTPVREVDRRPVPAPGPLTRRVQEAYLASVRGEVEWMRHHVTGF